MKSAPIFLYSLLLGVVAYPAFAESQPHLLQRPALNKTQIVFSYAGDLWTVDRNGGRANRLTNGVGIETDPLFSPDGATIAFTGEYDGNTDVFTIPSSGGIPKRLTYHPAADFAVGWTPDGKNVVFRSNRESTSPRYTRLFEVSASGGLARPLPLPIAFSGQFSPDATQFAYAPVAGASPFNYATFVAWHNYRGGLASAIWITQMSSLGTIKIPRDTSNDFNPIWVGNTIYFLSDRNGSVTLFRYDPETKSVTECVKNTGPDIRSASGGPGGIVYDRFGELFLYDVESKKTKPVEVDIVADMPEVRPRLMDVSREIRQSHISPTGARAVFEAHGEILTAPAQHGDIRDITNTPGVAERQPAWAPDGQHIAYFSDESGNYALHIKPQTGDGEAKKFPLRSDATYYFGAQWSPDSKLIAFHDNKLTLWVLDTVSAKLTSVDADRYYENDSNYGWSADSKWLAYTKTLSNRLHALFIYSIESGKTTQASDGLSDVTNPAFDRDGQYLYFAASTNYGPTTSGLDMSSDEHVVTRNIYAMVLAADGPSPIKPDSDEEKTPDAKDKDSKEKEAKDSGKGGNKPVVKPVKIDFERLQDRVVALPIPPHNYEQLACGKSGIIYLLESAEGNGNEGPRTLHKFDLKTKKLDKLDEGVAGFDISADGEKMLIEKAQPRATGAQLAGPQVPVFAIVPADAPVKAGDGLLKLTGMEVRVDPEAEWRQMYHEVWQIERSYFYDPHFHGVDTFSAEERYQPYLKSIAARSDLNYLFQEMLGPFSVGHLRGGGGVIPSPTKVRGGVLGADYEIVEGRYRIRRVYDAEHWNPDAHPPLAQPGLKVKEGDFLLAVNGENLSGSDDVSRLLEGTAGKTVVLKVASDAAGTGAHEVSVVPVSQDISLRNICWIEANRRKVDEISGGKLGYVYLPDTAMGGLTNFNRYYFAQLDKDGVVVDERFNSGGQAADYIIEVMRRQLMSYWAPRYGAVYKTPAASILGPKVMITNEFSGSGGDAMPWYFREARLGPLVGKRTWGGLVGVSSYPTLIDGGQVTAPSFGFFNPSGEWDVENHGVAPDYEVEMDPKLVRDGHDPQLEKAVALAMAALKEHPAPKPKRPDYPDYNKSTRGKSAASVPTGAL